MKKYDVLIIGGGAAGLFAAVHCGRFGKKTAVIEKNDMYGKKLLITGKGRCNVTNNCDVETVLKNIPTNPRFLYSALNGFTCEDTMNFFEWSGVPLKTERGNRVFPESDKSSDIVSALVRECRDADVEFIKDEAVKLVIENDTVTGVLCKEDTYYCEKLLVATGGKSYPKTGSTGDGYKFAKQAGHTIVEIRPSLVPIVTKEKEPAEMMGLSLKNVALSVFKENNAKPIFNEQGEMLFTHFGVSGPLVLSASSHIRDVNDGEYKISIDLKPALDEETLDKRVLRDFTEAKNRDFQNSLGKLLPSKMIPVIVKLSGIDGTKKVNEITREERQGLVKLIKNLTITILKFLPVDEAIITSGGVSTKEINPKTMESKIIKNLYFAGEVIDCDAYTGGFNLQIAFSTAYAFAVNI
ncbi:MAG: NAD(P)/FAD-dependent oxidoreductase [Oscillospiraceae bacterium]|nr:NAD(P)/FAD-dependent oxidoreductase [Oscillospiraceae bacterium]